MKKIFLLVIALFVLAACSNASANVTGDWKLVSYGSAANPTTAVADVDTSINFDAKGQVNGNVGCNGFGGSYEMKGDTVTFGAMVSTMMFCEATSDQEQGVLSVLVNTANLKMNGNTLTITSADGASVVNLARK